MRFGLYTSESIEVRRYRARHTTHTWITNSPTSLLTKVDILESCAFSDFRGDCSMKPVGRCNRKCRIYVRPLGVKIEMSLYEVSSTMLTKFNSPEPV